MVSWPYIELMRDLLLCKLLMQIAVHLVEEVTCTAVEDDVKSRLDQVGQVDDCIVLPILRVLLDCSKTLCYVPVLRERPATLRPCINVE